MTIKLIVECSIQRWHSTRSRSSFCSFSFHKTNSSIGKVWMIAQRSNAEHPSLYKLSRRSLLSSWVIKKMASTRPSVSSSLTVAPSDAWPFETDFRFQESSWRVNSPWLVCHLHLSNQAHNVGTCWEEQGIDLVGARQKNIGYEMEPCLTRLKLNACVVRCYCRWYIDVALQTRFEKCP
jgi:hypothetical protein